MLNLPGYIINSRVYEGKKTLLYRGIREIDGASVLFKFLKDEYPSMLDIAKLKYEFEINKRIHGDGIVYIYSIEQFNNTPVLVIEDFGGESLKSFIRKKTMDLKSFILIAKMLAKALVNIHKHNVVHKDINPNNIIINPNTFETKITDFEISTFLSDENQAIDHFSGLEGTLPYISPEQTGRMNRPIDCRADFYSLGITFYEMLSGSLPFTSDDALELVHCHLAREPLPLYLCNQSIPRQLSDIVMRLMEKKPEDRYQSALGLEHDLGICLKMLEDTGTIQDFAIGANDTSDRFHIPQHLIGREKEMDSLIASFRRVSNGRTEMVLVTGFSGIGKSMLVKEMHRPVSEKHGYFTSGKYEQINQNKPYQGIINAFQRLVIQILSEKEEMLNIWKNRLTQALGVNGGIITNVIPELIDIIGTQPPVPELPSSESQNRFIMVFKSFVRAFTSKNHPLVIFLDNLQWADLSSLKLIEALMADNNLKYLLLVGAYRDNEIQDNHPIYTVVENIKKSKIKVSRLNLLPLNPENIGELLSEAFSCDIEAVLPLAKLSHKKTGGNPFFLNQYLYNIYKCNLIAFNHTAGKWEWSLDTIEQTDVTDNVVYLMAEKIMMLTMNGQKLVQLAACIGNTFRLSILAAIYEKSITETNTDMVEVIKAGIIVPLGSDYKYMSDTLHNTEIDAEFKFFHNKIQQAAYLMLDEEIKCRIHKKLGRLILENPTGKSENKIDPSSIFEIVNHLNLGIKCEYNRSELNNIASLNLKAGKESKKTAAYQHALNYLQSGIKLLQSDSWSKDYELSLSLYTEAAEAACSVGSFEEMEGMVNEVLNHADKLLDKIRVFEILIQSYIARNMYIDAVNTALQALEHLGIKFTRKPGAVNVLVSVLKSQMALLGMDTIKIIELPDMTDPYKLAQMRIMSSAGLAAYSSLPAYLPIFVCKSLEMSIKHGNCSQSAVAYLAYGFIMCSVFGITDKGYNYGVMALDLMEKKYDIRYKGYARFIFNTLIRHWKEHARNSLLPLLDAYQCGLDAGDIESSAYSIHNYCSISFFMGCQLEELNHQMQKHSEAIKQLNHRPAYNLNELYHQVVLNLCSYTKDPCTISGECYDESKMIAVHTQSNDVNLLFNLYFNKAVLCYIFGDIDKALDNIKTAELHLGGVTGTYAYALFHFYSGMIWIAAASIYKYNSKAEADMKIKGSIKKLRTWAKSSPSNFLNKYYLLRAESYRYRKRHIKAMELYDKAIAKARENSLVHEEAVANELAAHYYMAVSKERIAYTYLRESHFCYMKWGANTKAKAMEDKYGELFSVQLGNREIASATVKSETFSTTQALDLNTIIKSTQALSGEIVLEELLHKLVKIILENSGAQTVIFLMRKNGDLYVEAEGSIIDDSITVMHSITLEQTNKISESIVNYVARTHDTIILDNASESKLFITDAYINKNKPKSVLCTPIINNGRLLGILYLENNLITGAFSQDRIELLNILCTQIAISIENASLYNNLSSHKEHLEELVRERTKELTEANTKLKKTTSNIQNLLNNAGQGFLSFGRDLFVNEEYSVECRRIFNADIEHISFPALIYPCDSEQRDVLTDILNSIFKESNPSKRDVYMSLLPEEIVIKDKYLSMEYKLIGNSIADNRGRTLMVIITDITGKRYLELQMEEERNTLQMIVKVVANYNDFIDCMKDYIHFYKHKTREILDSGKPLDEIVYEIYRNVHNFKGNFSQFDFKNTILNLHEMETALSNIRKNIADIKLSDFKHLVEDYNLMSWIELDLSILKNIMGNQFFEHDNLLNIEKSKLLEIEKNAIALLSPIEGQILLPQLRQLRYRPFKELLKSYPEYVAKLAERLEKQVYPVIISGGEVMVDTDKYSAFTKSLIHVFRNSVDHGVESYEQRTRNGKPEHSTISCSISNTGSQIHIIISDDGKGIDIENIRETAISRGITDNKKAAQMTDDEILNLLFVEEFTTKQDANELSGRGMGLYSVKSELDRLGGSVKVYTKANEGTEFHFYLPYSKAGALPEISTISFMNMLLETMKRFFYQNLGLSAAGAADACFISTDELWLKPYSVLINLKGAIWGKVILSADEDLSKSILNSFSMSSISLDESNEREYIEDVLGECLNTVLGNLLKRLQDLQELVIIEPPTAIYSRNACLKYSQSDLRTCELEIDNGRISISYVRDRVY
ncbi:MAG: AAA family ATPase [Bacillota bacterium]